MREIDRVDARDASPHPEHELILLAYGELDGERRPAVEQHVSACAECARSLAAVASVREATTRLDDERSSIATSDARFAAMVRLAASSEPPSLTRRAQRTRRLNVREAVAVVVIGVMAATLALTIRRARHTERAHVEETLALRAELRTTRAAATLALLTQPSSADRLRGIGLGRAELASDPRIASAFVAVLRRDVSANVRLAAVDALDAAEARPEIERAVLEALTDEQSPAVRLALIDLAGALQSPRARSLLDSIARSDADPTMRARASRVARPDTKEGTRARP